MKITDIKPQVKQPDRYSIFIDGAYVFSLSASALLQNGLFAGQTLDATQLAELKKTSNLDKAYMAALRYATIRPRSTWELTTYLKRKQVDAVATQHIMAKLQDYGYVDDLAFARVWIDNRRLLKDVSKRRLRAELSQKGVSETVIDQALTQDTADERATLHRLIIKKRPRYPDKQKLMQYLARQGFRYDDIKDALADNY